MSITPPEDNGTRNARSKISDDTPPLVNVVKRFKIILEEDPGIPPVGLFIQPNCKPYMLMAGVEAMVPQEVLSVLNDAVISVPIVDPQTQRVTGYRSRLRFPYRRLD